MHDPEPAPGATVWIRRRRWRVERTLVSRAVVRVEVVDRGQRATFLAPFDRPVVVDGTPGPRRVRPRHAIARCADLLARTWGARTVLAAVDAAIDLLPHQLEPVLAVLGGTRRLLLADEVGLGKTIQAGLITAELRRRLGSLRALFIVPAGLRDQWQTELASKFGVEALIADSRELEEVAWRGKRDGNPWLVPGVWIASLDYLKQAHVLEGIPLVPWDLVVVDEAHDACGHSDRYAACQALCCRARHLLLLTATPHSGDVDRFARLLQMGALDHAPDGIEVFRRTRFDLGLPPTRRVRWHAVTPQEAEARVLEVLAAFERTVLARAGVVKADAARLLLSVFRKRALSTMAALDRSLERRLGWLAGPATDAGASEWFQPRLGFEDDTDGLGEADHAALSVDVGLAAGQERAWLGRLRALVRAASGRESKVARLVALVSRSAEPVVVFTEFRHSLEFLNVRLAPHRSVAVLHGGQLASERTRELRRFTHGAATLLLATDVAGQGLNLQARARWVVSFELPWNPARLEQRVGRVDRIGQARSVHATFLVSRHAAEAGLLARLARRVMCARHALGEDALGALVAESESVVGAALVGGEQDLPAVCVEPEIRRSRQWERAARAAAKQLARKRLVAVRWRTPHGPQRPRPAWTTTAKLPRFAARVRPHGAASQGTSAHSIAVFDLPVLNGAGTLVERHVVAVRIGPAEPGSDGGATIECRAFCRQAATALTLESARLVVARQLQARLRRLRRSQRHVLARAAAVDDAIWTHLGTSRSSGELQPGLFDRRALRARSVALEQEANGETAQARAEDWSARAQLEIGRPNLQVVFCVAGSGALQEQASVARNSTSAALDGVTEVTSNERVDNR